MSNEDTATIHLTKLEVLEVVRALEYKYERGGSTAVYPTILDKLEKAVDKKAEEEKNVK